jgi:hypothetical protein
MGSFPRDAVVRANHSCAKKGPHTPSPLALDIFSMLYKRERPLLFRPDNAGDANALVAMFMTGTCRYFRIEFTESREALRTFLGCRNGSPNAPTLVPAAAPTDTALCDQSSFSASD